MYSQQQIEAAILSMADKINHQHHGDTLVVLPVMVGAMMFASKLVSHLLMPVEIDYVHATRYGNKTEGGKLTWRVEPGLSLSDRCVLLVDDIFDEGMTLEAISDYCYQQGARNVTSAVLINKNRERDTSFIPQYTGLETENKFIVGYGMDYKGLLRNLPAIYALTLEQ